MERLFSHLALVRNAIAQDLSTLDSAQTNKVVKSKQKVLKCPLGCDRAIRGAESKLGHLHMNKTSICT